MWLIPGLQPSQLLILDAEVCPANVAFSGVGLLVPHTLGCYAGSMQLHCSRKACRAWGLAGVVAENKDHSEDPPKGAPKSKEGKSSEEAGRNLLKG